MPDQPHTLLIEHNAEQYLVFRLEDGVYAIPVASVTEIVRLPELMPIDERAPHFIGVLELRGTIVPVIDLKRCLGRTGGSYAIDDYLLVLQHAGQQVALVVNQTLGVHCADTQANDPRPSTADPAGVCIRQVVTMDNKIVMLLDLHAVLKSLSAPTEAGDATRRDTITVASAADRAQLRQRAEHLRQSGAKADKDQLSPFAVAEVNGEFFGFDLQYVREFCDPQRIARVPCCPEYIVGNVNVRGDVLTVIDIRRELNLPRGDWTAGHKIIVARTDELTVGVLVDELHGVVYRLAGTIEAPSASQAANRPVVKGTSTFGDHVMCLLDLPVLLELDRWVVDAEVTHV